jgi:glycerol-3-phosphate dehydrogenase
MFFIIPFDKWSLIGTTDTKYDGDLDEVHADAADVDYLLSESRRILPGLNLTKGSILYTYAGIRPLAFAGERESKISRKHRVIPEGRTGRIITIAGGKYTTYRNMAEDVVDAACRKLGKKAACETGSKPLAGSLPAKLDEYIKEAVPQMAARYRVAPETVRHLVHFYGARAERVLELTREDPELGKAVSPESRDIYAQAAYSVAEEGAKTISDIVLRRMHVGITSDRGAPYAEQIAKIAGKELGWNADETRQQVAAFKDTLKKERAF